MAAIENNYQVKGVFNRMKHAVHYYDQMESKVLQATNMDAWGAPSSLMRSIADGTKETERLNIIMPAIYRRFIVKETRLWLQVYKALVLLEYLIKYGDGQVLGYVQSNIKVFDSLKTFEYIDEKGYDKGVNVRIRSKAIYDLVMDPEEVKKIRDNAILSQDRFIGVSSADFTSPSTEMTNNESNENVDVTITDSNGNTNGVNKDDNNTNSPATLNVTTVTKNTTSTAIDDEADNVIFREDFIDPNHLEEDNHAIMNGEKVFVKNKKINQKEKMDINDDDDDDVDNDDVKDEKQEQNEIKKNEEEANKQQNKSQEQDDKKRKSKSRFSFAGLFSTSKSKQTLETGSNSDTVKEKELPRIDTVATATAATATPTAINMKEAEKSKDEDDVWGDFASPTNDDDAFNNENNLVNLEDIFDISPSQSSTRTSSEDSVLLDLNLVDSSIMNYSSPINSRTSVKQEYDPSAPLTMKDFDPLNLSYNNTTTTNNLHSPNQYYFDNQIQNKVHQSSYYTNHNQLSHHQLAQPWSPWSNQRSNATVDDLLS